MSEDENNTENKPLFQTKREQRVVFFLVFMGVLTVTYGFLYLIDFIPEKPGEAAETEEVRESEEVSVFDTTKEYVKSAVAAVEKRFLGADDIAEAPGGESETGVLKAESYEEPEEETEVYVDPLPATIIFDSFEREVAVLNPTSRSVASLDEALLSGVVRHPDSADFANEGTIFLFGHSSYLPNVINKNFQAFNGIQDLVWGDTIRLQSANMEYVYRVDRVYQTKASDAEVAIDRGKPKLTLATCNTFGSKDDRYVVEASLVDSYTL